MKGSIRNRALQDKTNQTPIAARATKITVEDKYDEEIEYMPPEEKGLLIRLKIERELELSEPLISSVDIGRITAANFMPSPPISPSLDGVLATKSDLNLEFNFEIPDENIQISLEQENFMFVIKRHRPRKRHSGFAALKRK